MNDIVDLRSTIIPKSDQLNSDQLLAGPITITVKSVEMKDAKDQPVSIHYENENGRPFKPCLTMRKLLDFAWGQSVWAGRSMVLYNDPAVKWGGEDVGGIRISHLTHIEANMKVSLITTKGKKAMYSVARMADPFETIRAAATPDALKQVFGGAWKAAAADPILKLTLKQVYDARLRELTTEAGHAP